MWEIYEHPRAAKWLDSLPVDILKRYEKWKDVVRISGPRGLRAIRGLQDESLRGEGKGYRSSRLNLFRVIYPVGRGRIFVEAADVTAHDDRRK